MSLVLVDFSGRPVATMPPTGRLVVGRAVECDVTLTDPTISRRHAELRNAGDTTALFVRDLGSRNGTFRNGKRIDVAELHAGDSVTFGAVTLRVARYNAPPPVAVAVAREAPAQAQAPAVANDDAAAWYAAASAAQARSHAYAEPPSEARGMTPEEDDAVPMPPAEPSVEVSAVAAEPPPETEVDADEGPEAEMPIVAERGGVAPAEELAGRKLALLLDVAKGLGGAIDVNALLDRVVSYAFETLDADRAAILLATDGGGADSLRAVIARDRWGGDLTAGAAEGRAVPRSIVGAALERRAALLSVNAALDPRFGGQSVLHQRVRSAMCAPLVASNDGAPLGALYVDSAAPDRTFDVADLDFLSAFAAISASALETARLAERVRREAVARGNFERYFAPPVAERIARSSEFARPGGERTRVTVLFGDLRGFTKFAAGASPDEVADTISEYLSAMVDCVFRHGGTLDKFIGDAVMAQWGAPEGHPDDPDRAMRAALDMIDALDALATRWQAEGRPALAMGIGLSYGEVFAGNIGSDRRLEFTVLGDAVNVASRLCDSAGPNEIRLSDALRRELREPPPMRLLPSPYAGADSATPAYAVVRRLS